MKAMMKQEFFAKAIDLIKQGFALEIESDGWAVSLAVVDKNTGKKCDNVSLHRSSDWAVRRRSAERFRVWLTKIITSPEYGAIHSSAVNAVRLKQREAKDVQTRRTYEKADDAANQIANLLKSLDGFDPNICNRHNFRELVNHLRHAKKCADAVLGGRNE